MIFNIRDVNLQTTRSSVIRLGWRPTLLRASSLISKTLPYGEKYGEKARFESCLARLS